MEKIRVVGVMVAFVLAAFVACQPSRVGDIRPSTSQIPQGQTGQTLLTKTYRITIFHPCQEGCVSCDRVIYRGLCRKSGQVMTLTGSTWHNTKRGKVPGRFHGWRFLQGDTTYCVLQKGVLQIWRGDSKFLEERGIWQ